MNNWRSSGSYAGPIPFRLAGRESKPEGTVLDVGGVEIGGREVVVMAGPCSVESRDQLLTTAKAVQASGARILRGGAFKPRTSPYSFRGLREEGRGRGAFRAKPPSNP